MEAIARMIGNRLKTYAEVDTRDSHPDDDILSAFVEGRLEDTESSQIVSHLIICRSCRQVTAQMSRLDEQFQAESGEESGGTLSDLVSRILPHSEGDAVFAYQEPTEISDSTETTPDQKTETDSE
ncbi:MAG: hypothetical protein C5B55_05635 [Blastocatellia bacterium]|nr:MAG: hypothetical protein C5B55_05635 [Blastocatellia bacterium]